MMRSSPPIANTERSRHCIQAAYGAVALQPTFGETVKAVVLILCTDGVAVYSVPKMYFCGTLFARLTPVLVRPPKKKKMGVKPVANFQKWGPVVCKMARKHGLTMAAAYTKFNIRTVVRGSYVVGVAAFVPDWHTISELEKAAAIQRLQASCKRRHTGYVKMPSLSLLIATKQRDSARYHMVMASKPFCIK